MTNPKWFANQNFVDGTVEEIEFADKIVGYLGEKDGATAFVWSQTELYAKSDFKGDAYSMSEPLIDRLEEAGVESVYVYDAETWISFEDIQEGEELPKDDDFFNEEQDHDQRIVYVESWK